MAYGGQGKLSVVFRWIGQYLRFWHASALYECVAFSKVFRNSLESGSNASNWCLSSDVLVHSY